MMGSLFRTTPIYSMKSRMENIFVLAEKLWITRSLEGAKEISRAGLYFVFISFMYFLCVLPVITKSVNPLKVVVSSLSVVCKFHNLLSLLCNAGVGYIKHIRNCLRYLFGSLISINYSDLFFVFSPSEDLVISQGCS